MITIQIDDDVYQSLSGLVKGFNETPNDVIRRLVDGVNGAKASSETKVESISLAGSDSGDEELTQLISSLDFETGDNIKRYFSILQLLYNRSPGNFEKLLNYRRKRGKRINFAKDPSVIEKSGNSTQPKALTGTPFYVLTNLDNKSKRTILDQIMPRFGFRKIDIQNMKQALPDRD